MNKIKRLMAASLAMLTAFSAVGCGGDKGNSSSDLGFEPVFTPGFWDNLAAQNSGGSNSGNNWTGDVEITGDPTAAVAYDGSPVEITFYHTMGQRLVEVLDAWIPVFNDMYPNITVVHSAKGGYDDLRDTITTELQGGISPSIAYCYPDHVANY